MAPYSGLGGCSDGYPPQYIGDLRIAVGGWRRTCLPKNTVPEPRPTAIRRSPTIVVGDHLNTHPAQNMVPDLGPSRYIGDLCIVVGSHLDTYNIHLYTYLVAPLYTVVI
jgi:hypothetical protein